MANDGAKKLNELVKKKRKGVCCDSCSGCERERRYGTESDNQYERPQATVLPIQPPFVAPNFDLTYKANAGLPVRFKDADQALRDAQVQRDLYTRLKNMTTGMGKFVSGSQAAVSAMQDARDDAETRMNIASKYNVKELQTAYLAVTNASGGQPALPIAKKKKPLMDEIIDGYGVPSAALQQMLAANPDGSLDPTALAQYITPAPAPAPAPKQPAPAPAPPAPPTPPTPAPPPGP